MRNFRVALIVDAVRNYDQAVGWGPITKLHDLVARVERGDLVASLITCPRIADERFYPNVVQITAPTIDVERTRDLVAQPVP